MKQRQEPVKRCQWNHWAWAVPRGVAHAPGSLTRYHSIPMITLSYAIRKSAVHPKILKWILDAQTQLNQRTSWSFEPLNLVPISGAPERPGLGFPFVRVAPLRVGPYVVEGSDATDSPQRHSNAVASGTTKTRSLWECHLVASFLRMVSEKFPEIVISLHDDTAQFVLAGSVTMRAGKLTLDDSWLRSEQERILEMTGDPQAVSALIWAQAQALHDGVYLVDMPVSDAHVPEFITMDLDDCREASVGEIAAQFVRQSLSDRVPVAA